MSKIHGLLAWVLLILVFLHVAAAIKHHVILRDNTLRRMINPNYARYDI